MFDLTCPIIATACKLSLVCCVMSAATITRLRHDTTVRIGELLLYPRLRFLHPPAAYRLVLRRVRLHLRAIECDMPELDHPRLLTQLQDLHEQPAQRHVFDQATLNPAARRQTDAVGVEQNLTIITG